MHLENLFKRLDSLLPFGHAMLHVADGLQVEEVILGIFTQARLELAQCFLPFRKRGVKGSDRKASLREILAVVENSLQNALHLSAFLDLIIVKAQLQERLDILRIVRDPSKK